MPVPFNLVPSDIAVPFWWGEIDPSQASSPSIPKRTVLIGQMLAAGKVAGNTPVPVTSEAQAASYFGAGSVLHRMVKGLLRNDAFPDLVCVGVADNSGGTAATCTLTFTGPATAAGTIYLYAHNCVIAVGVTSAMTDAQIASAVVTAVTAAHTDHGDVPFTAAAVDGVVTLTFRHKGTCGNSPVYINYLGAEAGEFMPAGVACTVGNSGYFASGATNPDLTNAIAALNESPADYVVVGLRDNTNRALVSAEIADRWNPTRQLYGHAFYGYLDTYANLLATAWDDRWATLIGYNDAPVGEYEWAAAYAGAVSARSKIHPARPTNGVTIRGVIAPRDRNAFSTTEQDLLLKGGVTPYANPGSSVVTSRTVTTSKTNAFGIPDKALRDLTTIVTAWTYTRDLRGEHQRLFGDAVLVDNGTPTEPGSNTVTPDQINAATVAHYDTCVARGWVQNPEQFAQTCRTERDPSDPNRTNTLAPPILANPLYVMAVNIQFRLRSLPQAA